MAQLTSEKRTEALRTAPIGKLLYYYTLPSLVGMVVMSLYNIVDRVFIGQGVGEYAIAGLTLTFPLTIFMAAWGMLIGTGASTRVSIALGRGNHDEAGRILGNAMVLTFVTQAVTIGLAMIYLEPLVQMFGGSERTMGYAVDYLRIVIPGNIFTTLCFSYNNVMRASGYPRKAMVTMLIGAFMNGGLDALFIYGFGWGIKGAAWATVISMFVSATFVMWHFFQKHSLVRFEWRNFQVSLRTIGSIASIGASPFFLQLMGSAVTILYNKSFIWHSSSAIEADLCIGAYGIIGSYVMLAIMFFLGVAQGMQPVVGYNYGAGQWGRVREAFGKCVRVNTVVALGVVVVALSAPTWICRVFTKSEMLLGVASHGLRASVWGFMVVGYQVMVTQFMQSVGKAKEALVLSVSRQLFFLLPLLVLLPMYWGLDGVWYASAVADLLSGALAWGMMRRVWVKMRGV